MYKEIRSIKDTSGNFVPVGNSNIHANQYDQPSDSFQIILEKCSDDVSIGCGNVMINILSVDSANFATISINMNEMAPYNPYYTATSTDSSMYPQDVTLRYSSSKCIIQLTFEESVCATVIANMFDVDFTTSANFNGANTRSDKLYRLPSTLQEGVDYGTLIQRNQVTPTKGRIFFVEAE